VFADEQRTPLLERPLFLINCNLPEDSLRQAYPELYDYLQTGLEAVATRYLCKSKRLWYQQEQREPAPILCTYMGRGTKDSELPFRFILNHSRAIATNSYLMLYPRDTLAGELNTDSKQLQELWRGLNGLAPGALTSEGRVYGGGLRKIEPKELGEVICTAGFGNPQPQIFQTT
jgi:hypothetical protein